MNHIGTMPIRTPRLLLRRFRMEDVHAMYQNWASDPQVTEYLRWSPHQNLNDSLEVLTAFVRDYIKSDCYNWIICLQNGEPIGSIGVVSIQEVDQSCDVGYCIGRRYWNQGYTTEALGAIIGYLFEKTAFNRIEAYHDLANPASGRVMEKCGMIYEGIARQKCLIHHHFADCGVYAILKSDYLSMRNKADPRKQY